MIKVCEIEKGWPDWWERIHIVKPMAHPECIKRSDPKGRLYQWNEVGYRDDSYTMKHQFCCLCEQKFLERTN